MTKVTEPQASTLNKNKKVFIVGPTFGVQQEFREYGYDVFFDRDYSADPKRVLEETDFICFMGGTDISPKLYGQQRLSITQNPDTRRDTHEIALYHLFKEKNKLGICRGAQLLNVLQGGSMFQHVDKHCDGNHLVVDNSGSYHQVCSVHHQLIKPSAGAELVSWAVESTYRIDDAGEYPSDGVDPEVLFHEKDKALMFQAHPEFGPPNCTNYFFNLIEQRFL